MDQDKKFRLCECVEKFRNKKYFKNHRLSTLWRAFFLPLLFTFGVWFTFDLISSYVWDCPRMCVPCISRSSLEFEFEFCRDVGSVVCGIGLKDPRPRWGAAVDIVLLIIKKNWSCRKKYRLRQFASLNSFQYRFSRNYFIFRIYNFFIFIKTLIKLCFFKIIKQDV